MSTRIFKNIQPSTSSITSPNPHIHSPMQLNTTTTLSSNHSLPLIKNTTNSPIQPSLLSYNNPLPLQQPLSPPTTLNPFGSSNFNESITSNQSNVSSQHSILSQINTNTQINDNYNNNNNNNINNNTSNTLIQYQCNSSPLYNNNNNTNNSITSDHNNTNNFSNNNIINRIELNLIHNPNDPLTPKYKWNGNITAINGILSNKFIKHLNNITNVLNSNSERCEFELEVTDDKLKWLLPFDIDIPKENNNNNIENSISINNDSPMYSSDSNSSESSLFIPEPQIKKYKKKKYIKPSKNNKNNNRMSSIIKNISKTSKKKNKNTFKYSDKSAESSYCSLCKKHFNGYRGLVSHRAKVHTNDFYIENKKKKLNDNDNYVNTTESDSENDSDNNTSDSDNQYKYNGNINGRKRKFEYNNHNKNNNNNNKRRKLMNEIIDNSCGEMEEFSDEAPMQPIMVVKNNNNSNSKSNDWLKKKKLFQICADNNVKHLLGNTKWSSGNNGPPGLHLTPLHWCRYCGSRLSKRWYNNNRLCSKHMYINQSKKEKIFKNCTGKDLINNKPYSPNENKEFEYLNEFVEELNKNKNNNDKININNYNVSTSDNNSNTYDVYKLHCKKILYTISSSVIYYLVEWSGYDVKDSEWVPENNLGCAQILKEFENGIKSEKMEYCLQCTLGGFKTYTKPCFKHHFNENEYQKIFIDYSQSEIRQLTQITLKNECIKQYCDDNNYKIN